jgi:hypothetical protein
MGMESPNNRLTKLMTPTGAQARGRRGNLPRAFSSCQSNK